MSAVLDELKLYVWFNVLEDYGPGLAFALAANQAHAMGLLVQEYMDHYSVPPGTRDHKGLQKFMRDLQEEEPGVWAEPVAFMMQGSA